jgi:glycosyltransferase involved in cell wall biosynthesis
MDISTPEKQQSAAPSQPAESSVKSRMLAERLQIFIFTYNRAGCLEKTLQQLERSPFALCTITVLDNGSSDATPQVCERYRGRLADLKAVRHRKNIGCSANYLRAVEMAERRYTWILCDDDTFDWSRCEDIIEKIEEGKVDLISVGTETHDFRPGTLTSTRECALTQKYFLWHTFIPSLIFKTEHFDSDNLIEGYHIADTLLPHFLFVANMASKDATIYISRQKVIKKANTVGYAPIQFLVGWVKACSRIRDPELRRKALNEVMGGLAFYHHAIFAILIETTYRSSEVRQEYRNLAAETRKANPLLLFKVYSLLPLVWAPKAVHRYCWKVYSSYRERRNQAPPVFDGHR